MVRKCCARCAKALEPASVGKLFGHVVCEACLADAMKIDPVYRQGRMRAWLETEIVLAEAVRNG
jgi:recombinational DNA repair protein (RecF pathway)